MSSHHPSPSPQTQRYLLRNDVITLIHTSYATIIASWPSHDPTCHHITLDSSQTQRYLLRNDVITFMGNVREDFASVDSPLGPAMDAQTFDE
jgi:hypothetical protein